MSDLRPSQLALLLCSLAVALSIVSGVRWRGPWRAAAMGCLLACMLWHGVALLLYWQILPAYLACLLVLALLRAARAGLAPRLCAAAAAGLTLASAALLAALPLFHLPEPTGHFAIGTTILALTDPTRADASFAGGRREILVQVWYPAASETGQVAGYRRWRETTWLSSYDAVLATHSRYDAPPANGRFPLVLVNPAWEGQRTGYTFLVEELASHGFVVAAIDHTHNSMPMAFPDGRVLRSTEPHAVDDFSGRTFDQVLRFADDEIAIEATDNLLTLDTFAKWAGEPGSRWFGRVDTENAGTIGHSFGGAVAIAACARDARFRSTLNLDGWAFGSLDRPLGKPLFEVSTGDWGFNAKDLVQRRASSAFGDRLDINDLDRMERSFHSSGGYLLSIEGAAHFNFSDRVLYSPMRRLTGAGPGDAQAIQRILRAYAVAFFSQTLKKTPEPLLRERASDPGVHFQFQ